MNKNITLVVLIIVAAVSIAYFVFTTRSNDTANFSQNFLKCNSGKLSMPFPNSGVYTLTTLGAESGICHYTAKVVDQNGTALPNGPGGIDCRVPQSLITTDTLDHLLGQDKTPSVAAEQTKLQTDYCTKAVQ